ncbi:MAG: hypothetical protein ACOCXX_05245 [Planctomycetota bacterium]
MFRLLTVVLLLTLGGLCTGCVSGDLDIKTGRAWTPERYHDEVMDVKQDTDRLEENIRAFENREI